MILLRQGSTPAVDNPSQCSITCIPLVLIVWWDLFEDIGRCESLEMQRLFSLRI